MPHPAYVWIVGGTGMLGQAVAARLTAAGISHTSTGKQLDITQKAAVQAFAAEHRFSHLINCAAFTRVDDCEGHEAEATRVNGDGPGHVAAAAQQIGATALQVSTDYVFDGTARTPYTETVACAPLGAYGRSKLLGEQRFLETLGPGGGYIVRTSWLFGHGGPNFVRTMLRLMGERESLRVVADQFGRPTFCDDLAAALLALLGILPEQKSPAAPGVYHFANTGKTSWHAFATAILAAARAHGMPLLCQDIGAISTADYPLPARRPAYSVLSTDKIAAALQQIPRDWSVALDSYLGNLPSKGTNTAP